MADGLPPIILWFRRDLRLADHPALDAAVRAGRPVLPVFILDDQVQGLGAAPKWRLGLGLETFDRTLRAQGSRLILRQGAPLSVLRDLIAETGARAVYWSRAYDPAGIERDTQVKAALTGQGVQARSFPGHLLFEPWDVTTKTGQPFRVFTPMWRAVQGRDVPAPASAPATIPAPPDWPLSETLASWKLDRDMQRGATILRPFVKAGEAAAQDRLDQFLHRVDQYETGRDMLSEDATSDLSEYLSLGEIGPRTIWHLAQEAPGAEPYLRQLAWREFAYQLMYNWPHLLTDNWKQDWDNFPWQTDPNGAHVTAWRQARTGVPLVDAGLRQMYVTGRMHNRARMVVASYLTKHLMTHWRIGMEWFADCLTDWDPAANAMGWQWVAGSGPDAASFFRIFNPESQRQKFDPQSTYLQRWIAEDQRDPPETALAYFDAIPRSWAMRPTDAYPRPIVDLSDGRKRALASYETVKTPVRN
ncbi:deoxyribodipyrimidine photo-lyase [Ruegeria sp.]|uniref:cryptochrome/photolyase family protein n=1 Tax=Ruegeria sp. TaxID=1879320 RepID=UPI002321259B|nr:deoxyribodipyrimidine photo-lyase [Ruegeria sp.]MDA7965270.1 DNA photolyase family protein [Ruegeria sp.]